MTTFFIAFSLIAVLMLLRGTAAVVRQYRATRKQATEVDEMLHNYYGNHPTD